MIIFAAVLVSEIIFCRPLFAQISHQLKINLSQSLFSGKTCFYPSKGVATEFILNYKINISKIQNERGESISFTQSFFKGRYFLYRMPKQEKSQRVCLFFRGALAQYGQSEISVNVTKEIYFQKDFFHAHFKTAWFPLFISQREKISETLIFPQGATWSIFCEECSFISLGGLLETRSQLQLKDNSPVALSLVAGKKPVGRKENTFFVGEFSFSQRDFLWQQERDFSGYFKNFFKRAQVFFPQIYLAVDHKSLKGFFKQTPHKVVLFSQTKTLLSREISLEKRREISLELANIHGFNILIKGEKKGRTLAHWLGKKALTAYISGRYFERYFGKDARLKREKKDRQILQKQKFKGGDLFLISPAQNLDTQAVAVKTLFNFIEQKWGEGKIRFFLRQFAKQGFFWNREAFKTQFFTSYGVLAWNELKRYCLNDTIGDSCWYIKEYSAL